MPTRAAAKKLKRASGSASSTSAAATAAAKKHAKTVERQSASKKSSQSADIANGEDERTSNLPMGRALASTEKSVRDAAIRSLGAYLSQTNAEPLSDVELARLWKGIYYCFWMSDKPRVQQALAQEMADMLLTIPTTMPLPASSSAAASAPLKSSEAAYRFLEGFFDAMVREWWTLDKWRVDKYMMLVRRFINGAFRLVAQDKWHAQSVARLTGMLTKQGGPLHANDIKTPDGLMYHICDIYMDELEKVCRSEQEASVTGKTHISVPATNLLLPFVKTAAICHASHHYDRILSAVIQPYLDDCLIRQDEDEKRQKASSNKRSRINNEEAQTSCEYPALLQLSHKTPAQLRKEAYAALFDAASQPTSVDARRRRLYKMCKDEEERLEDEEEED